MTLCGHFHLMQRLRSHVLSWFPFVAVRFSGVSNARGCKIARHCCRRPYIPTCVVQVDLQHIQLLSPDVIEVASCSFASCPDESVGPLRHAVRPYASLACVRMRRLLYSAHNMQL